MHQLCRILEHVVNCLDNASFTQHNLVPHGHEFILHVGSDASHQVDSVLEKHIEEFGRDVSSVGKEFPVKSPCQIRPHLRVFVIHVGPCKTESDELPSVVADQMQFETIAPSHRSLSVSSQSLEHLVGIAPEVVTDRHHG